MKRRTFAVPPQRADATAGEPAPRGPGRNAPRPRTFAPLPAVADFAQLVGKGYEYDDATRAAGLFALPPREICDECGTQARELDGPGEKVTVLTPDGHASECSYATWPRRVIADVVKQPDGTWPHLLRPALAKEMKLPVTRCSVCRCPVLFDVEYDRHQHAWWCSWWPAHPGLTPF